MTTESTILTGEDKEAIDNILVSSDAIKEEIARAKIAGLDVADHEARLEKNTSALKAIRQAYFPNQ